MDADQYNQLKLTRGTLCPKVLTTLARIAQERLGLDVDGKLGPDTIEALLDLSEPSVEPATEWGKHALAVATEILGWGEVGANNRGPQIDVLRRGRQLKGWQSGAWCASTVSYEIEEGWARLFGYESWADLSESDQSECPIKRTPSAAGLGRRVAKAGRRVADPLPGDIVVFKYPGNHHIAIVSAVGPGTFESIDGNRGRYSDKTGHGSKVRRYSHELGEPTVAYFARLPAGYIAP